MGIDIRESELVRTKLKDSVFSTIESSVIDTLRHNSSVATFPAKFRLKNSSS